MVGISLRPEWILNRLIENTGITGLLSMAPGIPSSHVELSSTTVELT